MSLLLNGSASVTINSGAVLGITSGTAVASTSGTSIDFTGIPSWAKRVTVMLNGVSTNGTSNPLIQIGDSSGVAITGYSASSARVLATPIFTTYTTGFGIYGAVATNVYSGVIMLNLISGVIWNCTYNLQDSGNSAILLGGGIKTLSTALDRVRITTVNGTDTFDAGSINIMYE